MPNWAKPEYSHNAVNKAGRQAIDPIVQGPERDAALKIINNWRQAHFYPLTLFRQSLRSKVRELHCRFLIAQRIKRLPSIERKLTLFPHGALSQMWDIGGCRAVLSSVSRVRKLVDIYENNPVPHTQHRKKDYITEPKSSGYRAVHFVYLYRNPIHPEYNDLRIEMQIRSHLQHVWATAVEIVDIFTKQALKSNVGEEEWKRFFALMGTAIANREKCPIVPGTPADKKELRNELRELETKLKFADRLSTYTLIFDPPEHIHKGRPGYFLLKLNLKTQHVHIMSYAERSYKLAFKDYTNAEKRPSAAYKNIVLVSVKSLGELKRAYPNYFFNIAEFLRLVEQEIRKPESRRVADTSGGEQTR